jgi:heme exporter protein D
MNLGELVHGGGFGFYIWSSFGMSLLLMLLEPLLTRHKGRTIRQRISRMIRIETEENRPT